MRALAGVAVALGVLWAIRVMYGPWPAAFMLAPVLTVAALGAVFWVVDLSIDRAERARVARPVIDVRSRPRSINR